MVDIIKNRHKAKMRTRNLRSSILVALGSSCVKCGFSDVRALQVDHIHGGGSREYKKMNGQTYWRNILGSLAKGENKHQLLCANCNWIKRYENNEITGRPLKKS